MNRLYEGWVRHRRYTPETHELRYPVAMPLVDLDDLDAVLARHPAWGRGRAHPVRYRPDDHHPDRTGDLAERARAAMTDALGRPPRGRLLLLAHPRTWGWCFNPISLTYAVADDGVDAVLVEVRNTPWGERTVHGIDVGGDPGAWAADLRKDLHVSPFLPMDLTWRMRGGAPGDRLDVGIDVVDDGGRVVLDADLDMVGRPLDRAAMTRLTLRRPLMPQRTTAGIHVEALRLWRKGVPVHRRPGGGRRP